MRYFVDIDGKIHGIGEGQEELISDDWVELTDEELAERLKPTPEQIAESERAGALRYLAETDWYVVRFAETGKPIPEDILADRAAARLVC